MLLSPLKVQALLGLAAIVSLGYCFSDAFSTTGRYLLFAMDHVMGRMGLQETYGYYHCTRNRFGHSQSFEDYASIGEANVRAPPTIEYKDYSPALLQKLSDNYRLPVVVKGIFTNSTAGRTWSHQAFVERFSDQPVVVMDTKFPIRNISSHFQRSQPCTLAEYAANVSAGEHLIVGNDFHLMVDHPELIEELEVDRWQEFDGLPIIPLTLRMFLGAKDTGVGWHAATSHNLFINIKGRKLFKWINPDKASLSDMYPTLSNRLPAIEHCMGHFYNASLETMEFELQDGDACFTPAWVWHATHHYTETISVGLRMESFLQDMRNAPFLTLLGELSTDLPGLPFFNAFTRFLFQSLKIRLQGQPMSTDEKENGYKGQFLEQYIQAGGRVKSEAEGHETQWKL